MAGDSSRLSRPRTMCALLGRRPISVKLEPHDGQLAMASFSSPTASISGARSQAAPSSKSSIAVTSLYIRGWHLIWCTKPGRSKGSKSSIAVTSTVNQGVATFRRLQGHGDFLQQHFLGVPHNGGQGRHSSHAASATTRSGRQVSSVSSHYQPGGDNKFHTATSTAHQGVATFFSASPPLRRRRSFSWQVSSHFRFFLFSFRRPRGGTLSGYSWA